MMLTLNWEGKSSRHNSVVQGPSPHYNLLHKLLTIHPKRSHLRLVTCQLWVSDSKSVWVSQVGKVDSLYAISYVICGAMINSPQVSGLKSLLLLRFSSVLVMVGLLKESLGWKQVKE